MDPLSITASTVALARLCMKVSTTVYEFTIDTRDVDTNVQNLYRGLKSLSQVLTNVSTAWSENPLVAVAQTGPDGNLWICVKESVQNCEVVLTKLEAVLDEISAENGVGKGFMRRPVKQIRLNMNKKDIQAFGSEVQTYERALSIALNAINACAAMRRDHTDAEVSKRLETIETGIQDLSQSLRQRQASDISSSEATKSFEQLLQAANTFKSSASTVVNGDASTVKGGLATQYGGSIFGDSLSDGRYEIIQSWIPQPSPLAIRGSSTTEESSPQDALNNRSSLPELIAVLETVTQMADQYRNSEQERISSKDEQLRSLEMENRALEQKLEKTQAQAEKQRETPSTYEGKLHRLLEEREDYKDQQSRTLKGLRQQQRILASVTEERDTARRDLGLQNAMLQDLTEKTEDLASQYMDQKAVVEALEKEKQVLKDTNTEQTRQLQDERVMRYKSDEALALSLKEVANLNQLLLENKNYRSESDVKMAKLESRLTSLKGWNRTQFKEASKKWRDEADSLRNDLQRMSKEMDLRNGALNEEKKRVEDWTKHALQLEAGKEDSDEEIIRLKVDLEKSRSDRQDLENRLRGESEDFSCLRVKLECELDSLESELDKVTRYLEKERNRAGNSEKILAELAKLQEQQSNILSVYKAPVEYVEPPQPTQPAPTSPTKEAAPQIAQQTEGRSQDENKKENKSVIGVNRKGSVRRTVTDPGAKTQDAFTRMKKSRRHREIRRQRLADEPTSIAVQEEGSPRG
ncbi:hypothetical protein DL98DRAFT_632184 [Cadophora sp. DSE1049]|nr:hypothetical protein DL98DRAFT_632184 [Cadophora sp. DSE1049]